MQLTRRQFLAAAAALGAAAIWSRPGFAKSKVAWRECRERYPEGVASGDPNPDSVMLWTRYPSTDPRKRWSLQVEVAEDAAFERVVATGKAKVSIESDWTCRVLIGGLKPAREYWYRFTDNEGNGSRIGRTLTAPEEGDTRPVRFAFVSCQNANMGAQNAYRRMIYEDERAAPEDRLGFVLHLGDFIYEIVWYPEDRPQGMYDRHIRDVVRYAHGEKHGDFHVPTTVDDYRSIYRAYLHDPDLQDARARFPFVPIWDNHEFSWLGWQSLQKFDGQTHPAQTRKVAANQAWFEFHPARVKTTGGSLEWFAPPRVTDTPIEHFDDAGLGQEANNLAALASLTGYRSLRWGRHVELVITDQRSYRSEEPMDRPEAKVFSSKDFPDFIPQEVQEILDAGRSYNHGKPPESIRYGDQQVANFRRETPAQTILGATQKSWFLQQLKASNATWKVWGNTTATLDMRADPQNLPKGLTKPWPGAGYAGFGGGDHSSAYVERAEIYDFVAREGITGFATVAGDRHSFWAGLAAKALPPNAFEPVGVAFVVGSISAPGMVEAIEHGFPKDHPLRPLFLADRQGAAKPEPAVNMLLRHGVRSCLEYAHSGDLAKARAASNPDNAPHLSFVDMGGHGYAVVHASSDMLETEFVCLPRPIERSDREDGGALVYRVQHRVPLWEKGESPRLEQRMLEGDAPFSI
ncbi:alkaline phosphatase D family protein [Dyella kyungheensis]|uniref:Alkaline phosphatase D family protein n=1 Tax=Dyella kyungheensis TaxID=1242174 RepID=A0ABS2JS89_9GAMM|nr:alkaline phosphatase D family protein [Dyella kyungheensis]MBM7121871.1 alkaline phosphatase D family protein [Dyella kyungheensis]